MLKLLILLSTFLLGCSTCSTVNNLPLQNLPQIEKKDTVQIVQDEKTLIFMTISGGGTRAGAVGWRALEYLKTLPYIYKNKDGCRVTSNIADQIDYISGISGGSFASTGWCIYRDSMQLFRDRFINNNIQSHLIWDLFWPPWRGVKVLVWPFYSRINVASEYYDNFVFNHKKFKDLPSYPVLWINATNLAIANRFVFTKEQFDLMASDLGSYPLGYACAASSAFPILLDPITLRNYQTLPESTLNSNDTYTMAKLNSNRNPEKYYYCKTSEFFYNPKNKWIHLADGGLVDNQGLQAVIDQFGTNGIINTQLNDSERPLNRIVIINVNAGTEPVDNISQNHRAPGVTSVINYTMCTSMDILSAKRWVEIRKLCDDLWKAKLEGFSQLTDKPYCIEVNFRNVPNDSLRAECNKLPTSFYLNKKQIALIDSVVPILLDNDPDLTRLKTLNVK